MKVQEKDDKYLEVKIEQQDDDDADLTYRSEAQKGSRQKQSDDQDKDKSKQKSQKKKKLEPSLKWRALGMEEYSAEKMDREKRLKKKKPTQRYVCLCIQAILVHVSST